MRIVHVVTFWSTDGAYGGPIDTARRQADLVSEEHAVTLLAGRRSDDPPPSDEEIRCVFVPVRRVLPVRGFVGMLSLALIRSLYREIRASDVAHISFARELIPVTALLMSVVLRTPVLLQTHGMLTSRSSRAHRLIDTVVRPLVRRAQGVVCLTAREQAALAGWWRSAMPPTTVIGNPVGAEVAQLRSTPYVREALFVARMHPRKRVDLFAAAAVAAQAAGWPEGYTAYGPDAGSLQRLLDEAGVARCDSFTYGGALAPHEVSRRVAASAVFVLPATDEPWGNVLATALALGRPVVVTESAALAAAVASYGAGRVVADGDAPAIARAVHDLLDDEVYEVARGGALRLADDLLQRDAMADLLDRAYESVMRGDGIVGPAGGVPRPSGVR